MTSDELSNLLAQIRTIINNLFDKISRWLESSSSKKELTERTAIEGETIRCPRCLLPIQISSSARQDLICRRCGLPIPLTYVREYKNIPSVFIQLIGLPSTGKTTFLDTLLIHLYNMDQVWPDFYTRPLSQLDLAHKQMLSVFWEKGRPPRSTQKSELSQIDVYSIYLNHMERWRSCFLILMDHPGEYFTGLNIPIEQTPFLQHTPVTILLLSLPDMQREGKRMEDLINSYITSLEKIGVDFVQERRKIIIVFNKADLIPDLPQPLHEYLISDNIHMSLRARVQSSPMDKAALAAYLKRMEQISDIVRDWVAQNIPGGRILLSMLQSKGIDAKFTVMSATGHELSRYANLVEPSPRRVLDPFFWVLEFYNRSWYEQQATPSQNQRT